MESIQWLGENVYRRSVSVDFTVPNKTDFPLFWITMELAPPGWVVIPLSLMRKGVLYDFDIFNESRRSIPVFTREQHEEIAVAAVIAKAVRSVERVNKGIAFDVPLQTSLEEIVRENDSTRAGRLLHSFVNSSGERATQSYLEQRRVLLADKEFMQLLRDLAEQYLMCVYLRASAGERRIIKFGYEDQSRNVDAHWISSGGRRLLQWFGWWPRVTHVTTGDVSSAQSYHIEVAAPIELLIARADLRTVPVTSAPAVKSESLMKRVHFHVPASGYSGLQFQSLDLEVHFALDPQGFLLSVTLVAVATFLLLFSGLLWHINGTTLKQQDTAAVVVVALPGLLAALLFRSDEERLVAVSVIGLRFIAGMLVFASLMAAGLLAINIDSETRLRGWYGVTSIAGVAAFAMTVAWHLSYYWGRVASPWRRPPFPGAEAHGSRQAPTRQLVRRPGPGFIRSTRPYLTVLGLVAILGLYSALGGRWPTFPASLRINLAVWTGFAVLVGLWAIASWLAALLGWWWRRSSPDIIV